MAQARAIASPAKKQKEKEANKEQKAQARAIASPAKKQKEKEANKEQKAQARASRHSTQEGRIRQFRRSVKYGAIFVCICCHRKLFENGVKAIKDLDQYMSILDTLDDQLFNNAIGIESIREKFFVNGFYHLCFNCDKYIMKKKVPPMSNQNHLKVFDEYNPSYLARYRYLKDLSELENCMTAKDIPYMKVYTLPKSLYSGFKDRLVNIPIEEEDIRHTIQSLPRTPTQAGIIPVRLKRKKEYKNYHIQSFVSVPKIMQAVKDYKELGHSCYQDFLIDDIYEYEARCNVTDPDLRESLFPRFDDLSTNQDTERDILLEPLESIIVEEDTDIDIEDELEKEWNDYRQNDPVAKFQFDYNRVTCFGNDVPEISAVDVNEIVSVAPGEGKIPKSILSDPEWDKKSFPCLDPTGENHMSRDRPVKLSHQKFFEQ